MCDYVPKEVWIIFDPMDGPHIFSSKEEARQTYKEWEDSVEDGLDSFWDMTKPTRYVLYVD